MEAELLRGLKDPIRFIKWLWPDVVLYKQQRAIIESVWENDETFVVAGHKLGKDYTAGLVALTFFLTRHPCRVVTTSSDYDQLQGVLWGEIRRFTSTAKYKLDYQEGGPLVLNHLLIRKVVKGDICGVSYMMGRQARLGEGMAGHHVTPAIGDYVEDGIPRTLFIADEASGVVDLSYDRADTWAARKLVIGNPYPSAPGSSFFQKGVEGGDVLAMGA